METWISIFEAAFPRPPFLFAVRWAGVHPALGWPEGGAIAKRAYCDV